jgi:hypothetical protein
MHAVSLGHGSIPCSGLKPERKFVPSPRLAFMLPQFMAKTTVVTRKKRGPPPTGKGVQVGERWHPPELTAIDAWIEANDKKLTRGQAIRRLVELGLTAKPISSERVRRGRSLDLGAMAKIEPAPAKTTRLARARELAAEAIDRMGDPTAHPDERAQRRQRLTKGPAEFREDRVDLPKSKR